MSKANKNERYIYEFNLSDKKLSTSPAYVINIEEINDAADTKGISISDKKGKGKKSRINLLPSGISINPQTKELYLISAASKLLIVLRPDGLISKIEPLPDKLFPQAEGITFMADGTLLISNEAANKIPSLLIYSHK